MYKELIKDKYLLAGLLHLSRRRGMTIFSNRAIIGYETKHSRHKQSQGPILITKINARVKHDSKMMNLIYRSKLIFPTTCMWCPKRKIKRLHKFVEPLLTYILL